MVRHLIIEVVAIVSHISPHRDSVEPLVLGVPGARHKSFSTHELAKEFYLGAKTFGKVKIVRDPGDDEVYGPMSDAIQ